MHMTVSRSRYLSNSTLPAGNATGRTGACMCMRLCMENLTLRDTF